MSRLTYSSFHWDKLILLQTGIAHFWDIQGVFFYCVRSLIESPAFISYPILFIDPSFSPGDRAQSNEVSIIIVSFRRVELQANM